MRRKIQKKELMTIYGSQMASERLPSRRGANCCYLMNFLLQKLCADAVGIKQLVPIIAMFIYKNFWHTQVCTNQTSNNSSIFLCLTACIVSSYMEMITTSFLCIEDSVSREVVTIFHVSTDITCGMSKYIIFTVRGIQPMSKIWRSTPGAWIIRRYPQFAKNAAWSCWVRGGDSSGNCEK